jgi:hypothetical protein
MLLWYSSYWRWLKFKDPALKTAAAGFSETLVGIYDVTKCHYSEDHILTHVVSAWHDSSRARAGSADPNSISVEFLKYKSHYGEVEFGYLNPVDKV